MSKIQFAHICPTAYLTRFHMYNGCHLILAHLVESDEVYADFYANLNDGKKKIMDNSAFEMYKQGRPMYPTDKLIEMGKRCKADMIVMSDYPNEGGVKTIQAALNTGPEIKEAGFETFFVPQSKISDTQDYFDTLIWALDQPKLIDRIGLSILGCPNAYGVEKDNKLQRFLSRWKVLDDLVASRDVPFKIFHCLGMVDGPNEIELLRPFHDYIASWDSSAAIWLGLNERIFDGSPTGLVDGKFELEVDFGMSDELSYSQVAKVTHNMRRINNMVNGGKW